MKDDSAPARGSAPTATSIRQFGLSEDVDGVVADEVNRQRGDGGAEGFGDVLERAVGALEEIEQVLSLRRGWVEDVDAVPHGFPPPCPLLVPLLGPLRFCWASPARDGDCLTDRGDGSSR